MRSWRRVRWALHPEATALALGADGWLRTGDICRADADGYFYVVDRLKELIKCGGAHVAPGQLEAILLEHPGVADATVIGTPDDELGEVPKASSSRSRYSRRN